MQMAFSSSVAWVLIVTLLTKSIDTTAEPLLCPLVGPGLYGDLRFHNGCHLGPRSIDSADSPQDKMKTDTLQLEWLNQLSEDLLNSTLFVNSLDDDIDQDIGKETLQQSPSCGPSCIPSPQCCRVETRLAFPLFGRSFSTGRMVRIVQEAEQNGIQQPVVYRQCLSKKTSVVRGRCHQSVLPRLVYIWRDSSSKSYPFRQDLVQIPNNCDCIVHLSNEIEDEDEDISKFTPITKTPTVAEGSGDELPMKSGAELKDQHLKSSFDVPLLKL